MKKKQKRQTKAPGVVISYDPRRLHYHWTVMYRRRIEGLWETQQEAIDYGRYCAEHYVCDLTVMSKGGKIRAKWSYGNETKAKG